MKKKKMFVPKILISVFVVAIILFSTNAGAATNKIENTPEVCDAESLVKVEEDDDQVDEEPAGVFFTIVKVFTYHLAQGFNAPCFNKVIVYKGNKEVRVGWTWLFGNTFFFGLQAGQEYKFSAVYKAANGEQKSKSVTRTIGAFYDSVDIKMN